ncbi:MAG: C40 family peptidase [Candidatus Zixiibacteriota bacterium]
MDKTQKAKTWFLKTALSYLGTPYVWGGDDPSGFDCSGFVVECLKSAGLTDEKEDFTAERLRKRFESYRILKPRSGALLFSLNNKGRAFHVVICLDEFFQIGASGGGNKTTDPAAAWRDNAYIKIRPLRKDSGQYDIIDPFSNILNNKGRSFNT